MRHVVYASASCVGAPRALCCWRWRWQLTYFCGARRFSVHQAITIALFLVNLFTYTTSITTSTVLLVLVMALALAMVSALQGSPRVLVFGGETNAFGGKIYYTNSNAKTMISLCPVCGVQYISVAEFHTHTNSNDNTIISPYLVCGVQ